MASQEPDSIDDAKKEREEARRAQLEAAINLSLVDAEDEEIVAALEAATELVNLEQAKVDAASQRLEAVEDARADAQARARRAAVELAVLDDRAGAMYAVESYVGLGEQRTQAAWLNTDDVTTAAHKVALLDLTGGETIDVLDQLKALEDRRVRPGTGSRSGCLDAMTVRGSPGSLPCSNSRLSARCRSNSRPRSIRTAPSGRPPSSRPSPKSRS